MMNSTMFTLGLVLVLHLTSSCAILDQQVPEETDSYNGMEEKGEGPWSKWNRLRAIQLLEYQMVRALCRFDINLVQAMAPIWRQ